MDYHKVVQQTIREFTVPEIQFADKVTVEDRNFVLACLKTRREMLPEETLYGVSVEAFGGFKNGVLSAESGTLLTVDDYGWANEGFVMKPSGYSTITIERRITPPT